MSTREHVPVEMQGMVIGFAAPISQPGPLLFNFQAKASVLGLGSAMCLSWENDGCRFLTNV